MEDIWEREVAETHRQLLGEKPCLVISLIFNVQPIAQGVSLLQSYNSIDSPVLYISFATLRWKETNQIEIKEWDWMTLQMQ